MSLVNLNCVTYKDYLIYSFIFRTISIPPLVNHNCVSSKLFKLQQDLSFLIQLLLTLCVIEIGIKGRKKGRYWYVLIFNDSSFYHILH